MNDKDRVFNLIVPYMWHSFDRSVDLPEGGSIEPWGSKIKVKNDDDFKRGLSYVRIVKFSGDFLGLPYYILTMRRDDGAPISFRMRSPELDSVIVEDKFVTTPSFEYSVETYKPLEQLRDIFRL